MPKTKKKPTAAPKPAKRDPAEVALELLRKEHKGTSANTMDVGCLSEVREVIPTGLSVLDHHVLGCGGLPYGRIVELFGPESAGKSSLTWHLMAAAQRDGALVVFGQAEPALAPAWIDKFGVDRSKVVMPDCETVEGFIGQVETLLNGMRGRKMAIFLDSVAALPPEKAVKAHLDGKATMAAMAAAWSDLMQHLPSLLVKKNALLFLVNQLRDKPGVMYGPTEDSPGGRAIKFYATIRLSMWHGKYEKDGDRQVGKWGAVKAVKNKLAPPNHRADLLLGLDPVGYDEDASVLRYAKEAKVVDPKSRDAQGARECLGWVPGGNPNDPDKRPATQPEAEAE